MKRNTKFLFSNCFFSYLFSALLHLLSQKPVVLDERNSSCISFARGKSDRFRAGRSVAE